jgi:hypothetical protein
MVYQLVIAGVTSRAGKRWRLKQAVSMKKTSREPSFLSSVLSIFSRKPVTSTKKVAQPASPRSQVKPARQAISGVKYPYRAAAIVIGDCACDAVRAVAGRRFLLSDVPHVPVPGCTGRKCGCAYERYLDRRDQNGDRRAEYSALSSAYTTHGNTERRRHRERRAADLAFG